MVDPVAAFATEPVSLVVWPDPVTLPPLPAPPIDYRHASRPLAGRVDADVLGALATANPLTRIVAEEIPDAEGVVQGERGEVSRVILMEPFHFRECRLHKGAEPGCQRSG